MSILKDGTTTFASLEDGDLAADFDRELTGLVAHLADVVGGRAKATAKGRLTLTLAVEVDGNGLVEIDTGLEVKKPKPTRRGARYWTTEDGRLSTEHPQQHRFEFPARAVAARAAE